jgi:pantoate--beta-alanine ligase
MGGLVLVGGGALARVILGWFGESHAFAGYLDDGERREATRLSKVLRQVARALREGQTDIEALEAQATQELAENGWSPHYIAVRKALDLRPVTALQCAAFGPEEVRGLVVLGAAYLGTTRLIDNVEVQADL